jgi:hypothetical protein
MTLFTAYIIAMFIVAPEMPCSCGGIIQQLSWKQHIVFNCIFIGLNGLAIYLQKKEKKEFGKGWNHLNEINIYHS